MKTISLFSGAGDLDIGAMQAAADIVCAIDKDSDSIETLKLNHGFKNTHLIDSDISEFSAEVILERCKLKKKDIELLIGGPPCQSFSKNNYWTKGGEESLRRKKRMKNMRK